VVRQTQKLKKIEKNFLISRTIDLVLPMVLLIKDQKRSSDDQKLHVMRRAQLEKKKKEIINN